MTKFDYSDKPWWRFAYEATEEALADAGMKISDIKAIVLAAISSAAGGGEHQTHKVSLLSDLFKTNVVFVGAVIYNEIFDKFKLSVALQTNVTFTPFADEFEYSSAGLTKVTIGDVASIVIYLISVEALLLEMSSAYP